MFTFSHDLWHENKINKNEVLEIVMRYNVKHNQTDNKRRRYKVMPSVIDWAQA